MSIFYSQRDRFRATGGARRFAPATLVHIAAWRLRALARRAMGRAGAVLGIIHRGIVAAKMRRLQRELSLHGGARSDGAVERCAHDAGGPDHDAAEFARRPLLLGDKWDF